MNVIKLNQNNFFTAFEEVCAKYHTKPVFGIKKINPSEFRIECFIQADFSNFEEELASQKFWPDAKFSKGNAGDILRSLWFMSQSGDKIEHILKNLIPRIVDYCTEHGEYSVGTDFTEEDVEILRKVLTK